MSDEKKEPTADDPTQNDVSNGIKHEKTDSDGLPNSPVEAKDDSFPEVDEEKKENTSNEDGPNKKQKLQ